MCIEFAVLHQQGHPLLYLQFREPVKLLDTLKEDAILGFPCRDLNLSDTLFIDFDFAFRHSSINFICVNTNKIDPVPF